MKQFMYVAMLLVTLTRSSYAQLQPNEPATVAIFLYEGVELLDFAGPGEVFEAAGFKTYTVSVDGKELTSQGFVKIQPTYAIANAPAADIIVFPGGQSKVSANDIRVTEWIRDLDAKDKNFLSVCTGAFIIARAGLLDNKRVTTHRGAIKRLASEYPTATVMEETRWVDNGSVITTAGVSAGIDGALHFVAHIKGLDAAKSTAHYMEYDKWDPDNGVIDAKNDHLENLVAGKTSPASNEKAPFQGEYLNYTNMLIAKDEFQSARRVVDDGLKVYPQSDNLYKLLRVLKLRSGEAVPMDEEELIGMIKAGNINEALKRFEQDKKTFPGWRIFRESSMNDAGYFLLLEKKDVTGAIKVFELNTREFPASANTFDSLGEAYLIAGNKKEGIASYRKAAAMGLENAKKVLSDLEGKP